MATNVRIPLIASPPVAVDMLDSRRSLILAGGIALSILSMAALALALNDSYDRNLQSWRQRLTVVSTVIAAHAHQTIVGIDIVLRGVADGVAEKGISDARAFGAQYGARATMEMLRYAKLGVPQIDFVSVWDADGNSLASSTRFPTDLSSIADSDFFKAHVANPNERGLLFVGAPRANQINGRMSMFLSRKIRGADGKLLGVVVAGVPTDFFSHFYRDVTAGPGRSLQMFRDDGALLARWPEVPEQIGRRFTSGQVFKSIVAGSDSVTSFSAGAIGATVGEPTNRLVAGKRVEGLPLLVTMTATEALYLSDWKTVATKIAVAGLALVAALLALTGWNAHLMRQSDDARAAAMDALESRTRFVKMVTHEIRTPISAIIGSSNLLLETRLDDRGQRFAEVIAKSSNHLLKVVNDILDYTRLQVGQFVIEESDFELTALVANVVSIARALETTGNLRVVFKVATDAPAWVRGDPGRLSQALLNLLGNSVRYTRAHRPDGVVSLRARPASPGWIDFEISDNGPGIPADVLADIFKPFNRGVRSTVESGGTGLGLTISRRFVEAMGGSIAVESATGIGSKFSIKLPLKETIKPSEDGAPAENVSGPLPPLRILVADDVAANRMIMDMTLSRLGHVVRLAGNGAEVVASVEREAFDVVLMDVHMPEMDGLEATRRVRRSTGINANVPIIALTALSEGDDRDEMLAAGMNDVIVKPATEESVTRALRSLGVGRDGRKRQRLSLATDHADPKIRELFKREVMANLVTLRAAVAAEDLNEASFALHKLEGACVAFGYDAIARRTISIERGLTPERVDVLLAEFNRLLGDGLALSIDDEAASKIA
jgi:signal transduction histidine kinase/DNA-binding response OmpR family regulator